MITHCKTLLAFIGIVLLSACAGSSYLPEKPKMNITGFDVSQDNNKLGFITELTITNPNGIPLNISGIFYEIEILGSDIASGTNNTPMAVEAFSEESTSLHTSINLIETLSLLAKLSKANSDTLDATVKAKISIKGIPIPIRLSKSFSIDKP